MYGDFSLYFDRRSKGIVMERFYAKHGPVKAATHIIKGKIRKKIALY